ncbi:MAG TPA: SpoIIE family protein phosphatase [Polyangia bacterium]|nr:SpoIIE family protein phosphatase [Polyangia bacterium]
MRQAKEAAGLIDAKPVPSITIRWPGAADQAGGSRQRIALCGDGDRDVLFRGQRVCPRHAEIVSRQGEFFIVAMGDDEPILVNGKRILGEAHLREHDVIKVGDSEIRFRLALPNEPDTDDTPNSTERGTTPAMGTSIIPNRTISVTEFLLQSRALRVLSNATASLLVHHPFSVLFDRILDLVFEAVPADFAAIVLIDQESQQPVLKTGRDRQGRPVEERISQSIVRKAIEGQVAVMAGDAFDDLTLRQQPGLATEPIHRVICAPLWVSTRQGEPVRILGVLYANARLDRPLFRETDLEILTVLANTAAAKIETARLLEAGMNQRRMQEGLRVAAEIQANLLPRFPARVPGYDLAGRTQSSEAVGGDYYDLAYDGSLLHLALGDVAGKGVGAAMLMVELRSTVRANWQRGPLAEAATRINGHFHLNIPSDRYATFFLGRLSPDSGWLTYVNAGHNRPLLVGADGHCETLGEGGTAFGTFADSRYQEAQVAMQPNDTLVVYSDGISDAWPEPGAADSELADIVRDAGTGGANQIQNAIFEAADRRTPELPRDDRTLVVVRRLAE